MMLPAATAAVHVRCSWDTRQRLPYNRNAPRKLKSPDSLPAQPTSSPARVPKLDVNQLLTPNPPKPKRAEPDQSSSSGSEAWLPSSPQVEKPRSSYNAGSLAYIGDCIYEVELQKVGILQGLSSASLEPGVSSATTSLSSRQGYGLSPSNPPQTLLRAGLLSKMMMIYELYARRHFLAPVLSIDEYNSRVMAVVRCEAQDALLQKLLTDKFLSENERDILRWGKNINTAKTRSKKRAGVAVYNRASSLETLIGYLYLTDTKRLDDLMQKLGFSVGVSDQSIIMDVDNEVQNMKQKKQKHATTQ